MAQLIVMGEFQGPGEQKTAETLARELPGSWFVIAGRKLGGARRDDLDLVVVGERAVFLVEEKAWGPRIEVGDQFWKVKGEVRRNPLDRVNHLARLLAGQFRERVPGYTSAVRGRRIVNAAVVLSFDAVEVVNDASHAEDEPVLRLADASRWLLDQDASWGSEFSQVRDAVISFLTGLPGRDSKPEQIGPYRIVQEIEPIEGARCFYARDGGRVVILRCYPKYEAAADGISEAIVARERVALDRLEERDRTWQIHPSFEYEPRQWIVVPVVPAWGKSLVTSVRKDDPKREDGRLPRKVTIDVVTDAFRGLAEVHEVGLAHRGLYPRRIFLGRGLRVKFADFYLARVSGEQSIGPGMSTDADPSVPYRAPEARPGITFADKASDVYSLALSLASWVLGELPAEPNADRVREAVSREPVVGAVLTDCLATAPAERPTAAQAVERIGKAGEEESKRAVLTALPDGGSEFHVGGIVEGRYEIKESLGQGGFAHTWRAWDRDTESDRVIKQFHTAISPAAKREFAAADRIRHDLCARVYDIRPGYLVLEYIPGVNLKEYVSADLPNAGRCRDIALDVLAALAHLHSRDLLHRDVTPTNVIITPEGRGKLIDFGVASRPTAQTVVGTPAFMAPEVRAGRGADARSDLYEFAVTMIYVMLGRFPYVGDPDRGDDDRSVLVPPTADECHTWKPLGSAMLNVLFRTADANPERRPSSADELASELKLIGEIPPGAGRAVINPVVDSLRSLYRASSVGNAGNRGLEGQFARDTYVPTLLDTELLPAIVQGDMRLILLTGNPGDGKTSFLVQVGGELHDRGAQVIEENTAGWRRSLNGHTFVAVYDASESHEGKSSDDLMREALDPAPGEDPARRTVLLAVNDGRLLTFFNDHEDLYEDEAEEVYRQVDGQAPRDRTIAVVDLKRRTLAPWSGERLSLAGKILDTFTAPELWQPCEGCLSRGICPMLRNASQLRGRARGAVDELVSTSYLRRQRRATFRDVRSALAWLVTGDRACEAVHEARERGMDLRRSDDALVEDLAFDARSADYLIQEWADLDPARTAAPDVERAARGDRSIVADPVEFNDRDRQRVQRQLFFGTWQSAGIERSAVRVYRYLDEFEDALGNSLDDRFDRTRERILLGLSRLLGAPGYLRTGLAVTDQGAGGTWAVLKEIPGSEFTLARVKRPSSYVEWRPDALRLKHHSGSSLILTLDTFELVRRVADGDLIGDTAAGSVRQEIETFAAALRRSPAVSVHVVNPAGAARRAEVTADRRIALERA